MDVDVAYVTTGSIRTTDPVDLNELKSALADAIGVHEKDIELTLQPDGTIDYRVTADSIEGCELPQQALADAMTWLTLTDELGTTVQIHPDGDITVELGFTIDATNTPDVDDSVGQVQASYDDEYSSKHKSSNIFIYNYIF